MIELECPKCRKLINIPKGIDTKYYDGIVVCQECQYWWDIKLVNSKIRKIKPFDKNKIIPKITGDDIARAYMEYEGINKKVEEKGKKLLEGNSTEQEKSDNRTPEE